MLLKSLELNGFKSFAQKTTLEFPAGITAIVGPNGSGKSNIIDCIRWLLGEREAKNLRGAKIEDLIWNGTSKRPRVSMAQAGLHFDNSSGFFPVDFKEVVVSRRVGRDGNSEYFLNKSEVRLKDIIDFFSRSRLGSKGLSVIGQGSSDVFVRATPEERRMMIEEILGLREYQIKKTDAERKLKSTFFNLEKVKAMIQEVLPRLRLLKKQTVKWSKRMALTEELKNLENAYFSFKIHELKHSEEQVKPRLLELDRAINEKQRELKILETEVKKIESQPKEYEEIRGIQEKRNALFTERSRVLKELGRLEGKLEFLSARGEKDEVFNNDELVGLLKAVKNELSKNITMSDIVNLKKVIEALVQRIDTFFLPHASNEKTSELKELEKSRNEFTDAFSLLEKQIQELEYKEKSITSEMEEFNKQFQKNFELVESKRKDLRELDGDRNKVLFERERLSLRREEFLRNVAEIGRKMSDFGVSEKPALIEGELPQMEKRMLRLRGELASIGEIDEALIKEAEEVESHYTFLTNQSEDLERAADDLKKMIKELGQKIRTEFDESLKLINSEFSKFFKLMFGGGAAKLRIKNYEMKIKRDNDDDNDDSIKNNDDERDDAKNSDDNNDHDWKNNEEEQEIKSGVEIELSLPKKRITGLEMLSGGERSLVSIAALLSLIAVSPPPFLVLDEIDAALDESNSQRFANLVKEFSKKTQFLIATHNRATMEAADVLYGVAMGEDGASKIYSLKLE